MFPKTFSSSIQPVFDNLICVHVSVSLIFSSARAASNARVSAFEDIRLNRLIVTEARTPMINMTDTSSISVSPR